MSSYVPVARPYAIGANTTSTLAGYDVETAISSGEVDSEALLALDSLMDISGEKILIIKGKGGRSLLEEALRERGAIVDSLETYERHIGL